MAELRPPIHLFTRSEFNHSELLSNLGDTHTCTPSNANIRKRKRATPSSVEAPPVGGYGPLSPREITTDTGSLSPSPPPPTYKSCCNTTRNVWAFAQPLESGDEPPTDQWPISMEPHLTTKPKTRWVGCKLCSQFGCAIHLSTFGSFILTVVRF